MRLGTLVLAGVMSIGLAAGAGCSDAGGAGGDDGRPIVLATTTIIADLARELAGDSARVVGVMKPGEDPHKYDVRPRDAQTIAAADLVLMNGLNLEATLTRVVENNARATVVRLAEAEGIRRIEDAGAVADAAMDPHAWMSVPNFKRYATVTLEALVAVDPENESGYRARAGAYLAKLDALDAEVRAMFESVPRERRVLVTSHDAFNYLAQEYDVEVHGVIGISTDQQPRPQDLETLIALVHERGVRALFIETSVSQTLNDIVRKIADESGARIGGTLYSDSLDEPGAPAGSYIGMMRHNVRTIVEALQ